EQRDHLGRVLPAHEREAVKDAGLLAGPPGPLELLQRASPEVLGHLRTPTPEHRQSARVEQDAQRRRIPDPGEHGLGFRESPVGPGKVTERLESPRELPERTALDAAVAGGPGILQYVLQSKLRIRGTSTVEQPD